MGSRTIESWYNSGVGYPPFDRVEGGIIPAGLGALYSVAETDQFIYFIGDDGGVYQLSGYQTRNVSTPSIANFIENNAFSDAHAFTATIANQQFYIVTFPEADRTYMFSETTVYGLN
jgi:hypothetical protein